jgi:long-subunit acyl-CoA synthetase (AMP-forming)
VQNKTKKKAKIKKKKLATLLYTTGSKGQR